MNRGTRTFQKHQRLGTALHHEPVSRVGKRHMTRLLCDAYRKGVVPSSVENKILRAFKRSHDVTFAESFRTCSTISLYGNEVCKTVESSNDPSARPPVSVRAVVDIRNPSKKELIFQDRALLYGYRMSQLYDYKVAVYMITNVGLRRRMCGRISQQNAF